MNMKEFFYFRKSDSRVLLFLFSVAILAMAVLMVLDNRETTTPLTVQDSIDNQMQGGRRSADYGDRRKGHGSYSSNRYLHYATEGRPIALAPFDPNRADSTQLLRLGFAPWQVRSIYRYRAKGGVFRTPEDVAHIYGVTKEQYETLRPYIRISDDYQLAAHYVAPSERYVKTPRDSVKYPVKVAPNEKIVLNTADTTQLKRVPGIGSGWARRIFNYGKLLGGYVDIAQLTEIEGFPDEALSYFVIDHPHPQKMNLNKLSLNQLRRHPYINFYQARAICDYRRLKGPLQSLGQLRLLNDFTPTAIERLQPYVEF